MAVRRRQNWVSQQRVDVPHIRSLESATSSDFDELLKGFVTGPSGYILRGFEINMTGAIGGAAAGLQMIVADGCIFHGTSNESGTFFLVPSGTTPEVMNSTINTKVSGAFTPNAVNYVGIEYERIVDDATSDQIYIWDPTNKNEITKTVPLAKILRYKIVITSSVWAANVLPVAKVTTDVAGNVVDVTDQRSMLFRLGTAGYANPNPAYEYPWTNHSEGRTETSSTSTSNSINPFHGGDKQIYNMKEWMDAVMTSFKEIKGTTSWYSPNIGGSLVGLRADLANLVFTGKGSITHDEITAGKMNWDEDIYVKFIGGRLSYQILANASSSDIVLVDDQVAYFKLVREQTIVPNLIWTNASAIVASVGAVAWTGSLVAGDWLKLAIDDITQYYQIQSVDSLSQVTLTVPYGGSSTGPSGTKSQYAFGVYETDPAPSTDRHIKIASRKDVPFDEDTFWLMVRSDNGGSTPKVYARFIAAEIEQGETREINDGQSSNILTYIGALNEADSTPFYSTLLGALVAEETDLTIPDAASITSGQYFTINAANDITEYYVWFNKDGSGGDPAVIGRTPIEVAISTGDLDTVVASAVQSAINAISDFSASVASNVVTVINADVGPTTDAANFDVGGAFSVSVTTQGSGNINHYIIDSEDLTLSIKRLDAAIFANASDPDPQAYEEPIDIVAGAPSNDNEYTGPVAPSTIITIPADSRDSNTIKTYTVGKGQLLVFLNGQYLRLGSDFNEVGSSGSQSNEVEILIDLVVGDTLEFRILKQGSGGGGSSGGLELTTASNLGSGASVFKSIVSYDIQFRRINAGAGVTITENTNDITITSTPTTSNDNVVTVTGANYVATAANDFILVACSGADRNVTLPTAIGNTGKRIKVKLIDSGFQVHVKTVLGQTIDLVDCTVGSYDIAVQFEVAEFESDGANWWIV